MSEELEKEYRFIFERQHAKIKAKQKIYKLIEDSYAGSEQFKSGKYLRKAVLEYSDEYNKRLEDSTYENFVQPANDTLSGLLYSQEIKREFTGDYVEVSERIAKNKGIKSFMSNVVAPNSLMMSGGVLVDSPSFDKSEIQTKRQQKDAKLYPYAVYYPATLIRDFHEKNNSLEWILLDDTEFEKTDPLKEEVKVEKRTLWTNFEIIRYTKIGSDWKNVKKESFVNPLGMIPFAFCNWRDINDDRIIETIFEDIAELNKSIYNIDSIITESAFQSSFSQLLYPGDSDMVKRVLSNESPGGLSIIPVDPNAKHMPSYIQRPLANVQVLLSLEQSRINRIFNKIGLGNTSDSTIQMGWRSRKIEFEKCEAILKSWANGMEEVERSIFFFYGLWDKTRGTYIIEYPKDFQSDSVIERLEMLKELLLMPLEDLKRRAIEMEIMKVAGIEIDEEKEEGKNSEIETDENPVIEEE